MKVVVLILENTELMQPILEKLERRGVGGATTVECRGAAKMLENYSAGSFLGSLRAVMEPARESGEIMFTVVDDDKVDLVFNTVSEFVDLDAPYQGVMFTMPVERTLGLHKRN